MYSPVEYAKIILSENREVQYGIFGHIANSDYFPPMPFLNKFFMCGSDPCDQDGRMAGWVPFSLKPEEYIKVKEWWLSKHPWATEDSLGAASWDEWVVELLNR